MDKLRAKAGCVLTPGRRSGSCSIVLVLDGASRAEAAQAFSMDRKTLLD